MPAFEPTQVQWPEDDFEALQPQGAQLRLSLLYRLALVPWIRPTQIAGFRS